MTEQAGLRERLVQAGTELLEEEGLEHLTLRAVTRRAGVSHGAPRRYFPTQNALFAAIAATGLADLGARLRPDPSRPAEEQLVETAVRYLEFAAERPAMFTLIFRHDLLVGAGENLRSASLPLFEQLVTLVRQARPGIADPRERALAVFTTAHGFAALHATTALTLFLPSPVNLADQLARAIRAQLS